MNRLKIYFVVTAAVITASCNKDFLNVNDDPNRVTDNSITPELIFPAAANAVGQFENIQFLDYWMGYTAPNGGFVPQQDIITYKIDFTFGDATFVNRYNTLFDLHQTEVKAIAKGDTALAGASMILSAKIFQELVDLYGNIPFSQAFQIDKYPLPVYDNAQTIYNDLQDTLDLAIKYLGQTPSSLFTNADIVNSGNESLWIHFANTLKLRLLIRQSEVSGFDPSAEIAKITATGGVLTAGESIDVNPGYSNDVGKQNPFYAANGWTPTGVIANGSTNANSYIINILQSTEDPRLGRFFFPVGFQPGGNFKGNILGNDISTLSSSTGTSYFGPALVGDLLPNSNIGNGYSQSQFIYPSFESLFLYAEAVARGWFSGDAQTAYEDAVTESFVWLGVPDAATAASDYLSSSTNAEWANAGSTPESQSKFIVNQKYIALTEIDPLESYSDQRRLHFLTDDSYLSNYPGAATMLPLRLLYPQSEYTSNAINVLKEGTIDAFSTKLFWEP